MLTRSLASLRALTVFAALLLFAGTALPATDFVVPSQRLENVELVVGLGELHDISVSAIPEAKKPDHLVGVTYDWRVYEITKNAKTGQLEEVEKKGVRSDLDGRGVWFGTGTQAKRLYIRVNVSYLYAVKKDNAFSEVGLRTRVLASYVDLGSPAPVPNPTPPAPPSPIPDGKYKLAKITHDSAVKSIPADQRQRICVELARSYRSICSAIAAGAIKDPQTALKQVTESNQRVVAQLGVTREMLTPLFTDLQEAVFALYDSQRLNSVTDFKDAFNEIADGFEKVN